MILQRAIALCNSAHASLWLLSDDGKSISIAAETHVGKNDFGEGPDSATRQITEADSRIVQSVVEARTIHIPDILADPRYQDQNHVNRNFLDASGIRSTVIAPLISGGRAIGTIMISTSGRLVSDR